MSRMTSQPRGSCKECYRPSRNCWRPYEAPRHRRSPHGAQGARVSPAGHDCEDLGRERNLLGDRNGAQRAEGAGSRAGGVPGDRGVCGEDEEWGRGMTPDEWANSVMGIIVAKDEQYGSVVAAIYDDDVV